MMKRRTAYQFLATVWALALGGLAIRYGSRFTLPLPQPAATLVLTAGTFLLLLLMFRPLELASPAKPGQRLLRPQFWTDLLFFLGQYVLFHALILGLLARTQNHIHAATPERVRHSVGALPWWAQAVLVIFLSDLLSYWGHRLQHRIGFLWRFHVIHHSIEHLDWLAGHREHPLDTLYTLFWVYLPIYALGFSMPSLVWLAGFRALWGIFTHANVRLPIGPLRLLVGAPEIHHWHHDRERDAGNYAPVSPLMDVLFGTYHCPGREPESFGVKEPVPDNYFQQLIHPFLARQPVGKSAAGSGGKVVKKIIRRPAPPAVRAAENADALRPAADPRPALEAEGAGVVPKATIVHEPRP